MWPGEEKKVGGNVNGGRAARECQPCSRPAGNVPAGSILGLTLLEAFTDALDDGMGMASASWGAIPNWAVVGILEARTGVQRGLEKPGDGSLLMLDGGKGESSS